MILGLYGQSEEILLDIYDENAQYLDNAITFATGDVKISKDGGAYANTTNLPTLVSGGNTWKLTLTSAEKTCARWSVQIKDQDGPSFTDQVFMGYTYGNASAAIPSMPATIAVGAIASDAITSSQIADNAITAGKIASNAITSAKIATDAITSTQIATGAIKSGAIASAELNNISDNLLKRDFSSVTGEAARSLLNALRFLRNKWSISGSTLTVTKEDDSTSAWTSTLTTNASANPVTGSDPA